MKFQCGIAVIYHDINHEARSMEMLKSMEQLCNQCFYVSYIEPLYPHTSQVIRTAGGKLRYLSFIRGAINAISKLQPDLVFLHDNMCAPILKWLVKHQYKGRVIYDSSELFVRISKKMIIPQLELDREKLIPPEKHSYSIKSWILTVKIKMASGNMKIEQKYIQRADVVIAANLERAEYMRTLYGLSTLPCVYDNMHRIDEPVDEAKCTEKFARYFKKRCFHIVYAGGIDRNRRTFELVRAVGDLAQILPVRLLILGREEKNERKRIDHYVQENELDCIHYLGYLTRGELKYILNHAQISVSAFQRDSINNLYCASGKIYESLFEGIPILTSENPPLKKLCTQFGVGVSNDDFSVGIQALYKQYDIYCENVKKYIATLHYEERIELLTRELQLLLDGK